MSKKLFFAGSLALFLTVFGAAAVFRAPSAAAETKTGVGLSEHVLSAYSEGWKYRSGCYGQFVNGTRSSDCSGLIKSYLWWTGAGTDPDPALLSVAGSSNAMYSSASEKGSISDSASLPKIHGLILYNPGHVGVYVGNNMEVDNRGTAYNMKYQAAVGGNYRWGSWFKLPQIQYPETGFATFEGNQYYYENGEYVTGTTRTLDGVTYAFDSSGELVSGSPQDTAAADAAAVEDAASGAASAAQASAKTSVSAVPEAATASSIVLRQNSSGAQVKKLQQRLSDLGYYHEEINTYYDAFVSDAVKAFQKASGLDVTGTADETAQTALYSSEAKQSSDETIEPGLHSSLVTAMQKRLIELGYMTGEPTPYYGDITKAAVLAFQQANGLDQTGVMDAKALDLLSSDSAVKAPSAVVPTASNGTVSSSPATKTQTSATATLQPKNDAGIVHAAEIGDTGGGETEPSSPWSGVGCVVLLASFLFAFLMMFFRKLLPKAAAYAAGLPGKIVPVIRASGAVFRKIIFK